MRAYNARMYNVTSLVGADWTAAHMAKNIVIIIIDFIFLFLLVQCSFSMFVLSGQFKL